MLDLLNKTDAAIAEIKAAFGAPGDWGYGTPQGDALLTLYRVRLDLADAAKSLTQQPA